MTDNDEHRPSDRTLQSPSAAATTTGDPRQIRCFAIACARLLRDDKCEHVVLLDVRDLSQVTDYIVIASGTSDRQMNASLEHCKELGEEHGFQAHRVSQDERSTWLLADFVDVVVHLFEPNTRSVYDLEMLWGDAGRIQWRREGPAAEPGEPHGGDGA